MKFGERIKNLREENNLLQRQIANELDMDTAMLSKIERGERRAKREHIPILANIFDIDVKDLVTIWLADQVYAIVCDEEVGEGALRVAESNLKYSRK